MRKRMSSLYPASVYIVPLEQTLDGKLLSKSKYRKKNNDLLNHIFNAWERNKAEFDDPEEIGGDIAELLFTEIAAEGIISEDEM